MTMVASNGLESAALVDRAVAGDEMAFARIVAAHHDDLSRVAFVVTRDIDLAQEAVQDAWTIAWRQLPRLRERDKLRAWLVAIAANQARQVMRRSRRRAIVEIHVDDDPGQRGSDARLGGDHWADDLDLRDALAHLKPDDRALLALRYVAGLDSTELAHFTGLSPSGTRARLARLLAELRKELSHV
jgi:RNA polymerase sigma-70 factor, ECF subfamily